MIKKNKEAYRAKTKASGIISLVSDRIPECTEGVQIQEVLRTRVSTSLERDTANPGE